jgi:threonylcarbamoyladenosine tRNA methylthiotransferase MtaB
MRVALGTLGCKLNQAETERLTRELLETGHVIVDPEGVADVYILNTCTVTRTADAKCRAWLKKAHRGNPEARLVITGCYAQRMPEELAQMEGVCVVAGNEQKPGLLSLLRTACIPSPQAPEPLISPPQRTRSFVKIQDGCDRDCSYCIVPHVRGREKSRPADDIIGEVNSRTGEGYREVVLTGTEVGAYGGGVDLQGLLLRVLGETEISRVRLSSLQPQEVTPEVLKVWHDERMCPHFHLCLQSGSDNVLRRMKRRYSAAAFGRVVRMIRDAVPDASITTDIIVGFPGETETEFAESLDFCRETGFARINVFPYSSRPGTAADVMSGQVTAAVKRERSQKMLAMGQESGDAFLRQFIGRTMPVLWERSKMDGNWSGLTGNFIKVYAKSEEDIWNRVTPSKLMGLKRGGMWGERGDFT